MDLVKLGEGCNGYLPPQVIAGCGYLRDEKIFDNYFVYIYVSGETGKRTFRLGSEY